MSDLTEDADVAAPTPAPTVDSVADPSRWRLLVAVALAQLMIVLDSSVLNVALPSAQSDLGMSDAARGWVITGYTLTFGGFLLLGGRLADLHGRRRVFVTGLVGFAAVSAVCALSVGPVMLPISRTVQGVFAALLAPAALALLAGTFTDPKERGRAFAVYGMTTGIAGAVGLLIGGALTEAGSWRWTLWINVPLALAAALGALLWAKEGRGQQRRGYDVPGAVTVVIGTGLLAYGFSAVLDLGWTAPTVLSSLIIGAIALAAFFVIESRSAAPLLPLSILSDRTRGSVYITVFAVGGAMLALFLFLSYLMQEVLGYTALETGLAFLPFGISLFAGSMVAGKTISRTGPRSLLIIGLGLGAIGLAYLGLIGPETSFVAILLPAQLIAGFGIGLVMVPASAAGVSGIAPSDLGVASATINASRQLGGTIGLALLNVVAVAVGRAGGGDAAAVAAGYARVMQISAAALLVVLVLTVVMLRSPAKTGASR